MLNVLLCILWMIVSLFLILIILLQRGKGGGLAGALGGVGGSSAFGTKAGDVFTRITVGVFGFWLLLAMILVWSMKTPAKFVGVNAKDKDKVGAKATDKEGVKAGTEANPQDDAAKSKLQQNLGNALGGGGGDSKSGNVSTTSTQPPPNAPVNTSKEPGNSDTSKSATSAEQPKVGQPKSDGGKPAPKDDKSKPAKDGGKTP